MQQQTRAAIYCRISDARDGETAGVDRQRAECMERVRSNGWILAAEYIDNGKSAMTGTRPMFEQMIQDLNGIDVIVVWSADRLYRRLRDLERLVEVLGDTRVEAIHSGDINLATADGRSIARILGSLAQRESEKLAERVSAAYEERARAGKWVGGARRFGYTADASALVPEEAEAVRDAYMRLDSGQSLNSITRLWNDSGLRGPKGGTFQSKQVRDVLLRPRNAGLAVYHGQVVGESEGPAIIDTETWSRVKARLESNPGPGRTAKRLMSGIARCGVCGNGLISTWTSDRSGRKRYSYRCKDHHVAKAQHLLESLVVVPLLEILDSRREEIAAAVRPKSDALDAGDPRRELDALAQMLADGRIGAEVYAPAATRLQERIAVMEAAPKGTPSAAVQGLLASGDVYAAWDRCPTAVQRQVIELMAESIVVNKGGKAEIQWRNL